MVQLTERDETLLEWLRVVRMADLDAIRWVRGNQQQRPKGASHLAERATADTGQVTPFAYLCTGHRFAHAGRLPFISGVSNDSPVVRSTRNATRV